MNKNELYEEINYLKSELDLAESTLKEQRADIKSFILLLIENDIPIPENLINKYINKAPKIKPVIELQF